MKQRAELPAVTGQAEGRTDKCNAELVQPAQEGLQKGSVAAGPLDEDHVYHYSSCRMSLMKMVSRMHGRSSQALVEANMKTTAESHVKEELNHMHARG